MDHGFAEIVVFALWPPLIPSFSLGIEEMQSRVRLGGTIADSVVVRGLATGVDSGMDAFRGATGDLKH